MSSDTGSDAFLPRSGVFHLRFRGEREARTAARDATGAGFAVTIGSDRSRGWLLACRRRSPFPSDEQDRYEARLQVLAAKHGGSYDRFVVD